MSQKMYKWQVHEKMLHIISYYGNANQNHFTPNKMPKMKNPDLVLAKGLEEPVLSHTVEGSGQCYNHTGKRVRLFLIKLNKQLYSPAIPSKRLVYRCLFQIYSQCHKSETTQKSIYRWMDKQNVTYPYNERRQ